MKTTKIFCTIAIFSIVCSMVLSGCGVTDSESNKTSESSVVEEKSPGPEVGKWHAEYKISDIDEDSMAEEDRVLLSMLAGNLMFEMDVEFCEDGTFTYTINTDEVKEAVSNSVSKIASYFIDIDLSLFTDRLVEAAFEDVMSNTQSEYVGDYSVSDDGLITANDEGLLKGSKPSTLYFKIISKHIVQVDENGEQVFVFKQSDSSK